MHSKEASDTLAARGKGSYGTCRAHRGSCRRRPQLQDDHTHRRAVQLLDALVYPPSSHNSPQRTSHRHTSYLPRTDRLGSYTQTLSRLSLFVHAVLSESYRSVTVILPSCSRSYMDYHAFAMQDINARYLRVPEVTSNARTLVEARLEL